MKDSYIVKEREGKPEKAVFVSYPSRDWLARYLASRKSIASRKSV